MSQIQTSLCNDSENTSFPIGRAYVVGRPGRRRERARLLADDARNTPCPRIEVRVRGAS